MSKAAKGVGHKLRDEEFGQHKLANMRASPGFRLGTG